MKKMLIFETLLFSILISSCQAKGTQKKMVKKSENTDIFTLCQPIKINDVLYYKDDGTTGIVIRGVYGRVLKFCLDGRLLKSHQTRESSKLRHLYIGDTYPVPTRATTSIQKIPIGGFEEETILKILQNWMMSELSEEEQEKLLNRKGIKDLSEEERRVYRVMRVIEVLRNRPQNANVQNVDMQSNRGRPTKSGFWIDNTIWHSLEKAIKTFPESRFTKEVKREIVQFYAGKGDFIKVWRNLPFLKIDHKNNKELLNKVDKLIEELKNKLQYTVSKKIELIAKEGLKIRKIGKNKKCGIVIGEHIYLWNGYKFQKKEFVEQNKVVTQTCKVQVLLEDVERNGYIYSDEIAIVKRWNGTEMVEVYRRNDSFVDETGVYDLFNDGEPEVILVTTGNDPSYFMSILEWNGKAYIEVDMIDNNHMGIHQIRDLDGDGIKEIVFGAYLSRFPWDKYIYDWNGERYLPIINAVFSRKEFFDKGIAYKIEGLGDIDSDNEIEVIVTNKQGEVFICERFTQK